MQRKEEKYKQPVRIHGGSFTTERTVRDRAKKRLDAARCTHAEFYRLCLEALARGELVIKSTPLVVEIKEDAAQTTEQTTTPA